MKNNDNTERLDGSLEAWRLIQHEHLNEEQIREVFQKEVNQIAYEDEDTKLIKRKDPNERNKDNRD